MHSEGSANFSHRQAFDLWQALLQQSGKSVCVIRTHRVADRDI